MDPAVGAALVAGFVGVIVGLMGLVQATRAARLTKEAQVAIARMNLEAESRQQSYQLAVAEAKPAEEATDHLWSAIQALREQLLWLGDPRGAPQIDYKHLRSNCEAVVRSYSEFAGRLVRPARLAAHEAKNIADAVAMSASASEQRGQVARSDETQRLFLEARAALAGCQDALLGERPRRREDAFADLLVALGPTDGRATPAAPGERVDS